MTVQQLIRENVEEFENILREFDERGRTIIGNVASKTKRTKKYIKKEDEFYKRIRKKIKNFYNELSALEKEMEYKSLNVAFFGETNAGKSTLIEALTKGDGATIGDGRKDFTRTARAKNFGRKIFLLDMPGVEGDESKVSKEIRKAAKRAHIIFVVIPENKEPEEGFLEKVRTYIGENTFVFGIINLRGTFPLNVLENKKKSIEIVKKRTEQKLRKEFGKSFKEIFVVHSLYAFFAMGSDIPENLKPSYERAMAFVKGNKEKLKEASGIERIIEVIEAYKTLSHNIILWSNVYKLFKKEKELITNVKDEKDELQKTIKGFLAEIDKLRSKFNSQSKILLSDIDSEIFSRLDELKEELEELICEAIDGGWDEDTFHSEIEERIESFTEEIEYDIECLVDKFVEDVNKDIKNLIKRLKLKFVRTNIGTVTGISINFKEAFNSLSWSFKEKLFGALTVLESIAAILAGPVGAIVVGIISLIGGFISWLFGKESKKIEAKKKAINSLNKTIANIRTKLKRKINGELRKLKREINKVETEISEIGREIENKVEYWNVIIYLLVEHYISFSTSFFKSISPSVEFAFIDPDSGRNKEPVAIVVGGDIEEIAQFSDTVGIKVYLEDSIESALRTLKSKNKALYKEINSLME